MLTVGARTIPERVGRNRSLWAVQLSIVLMELSTRVRLRYLSVSGGWLGQLIISTSNVLGVFDVLLLAVVGVVWYLLVRTSMKELSIVFGLYLDGVIPLQYYQNESSYAIHKDHLDDYWPLFFAASLCEAVAYLILPTSFSLVVGVKSLVLCFIWMGRKEDGVFLSTALRKGKLAAPSQIPLGGSNWVDNSPSTHSSTPIHHPLDPTLIQTPSPDPSSKIGMNLARINDLLRELYPDDTVRQGMIETYRAEQNEEHAEEVLRKWATERSQVQSRTAKYRARGLVAQQWRKELRDNRVPVFVDDDSVKWNEELRHLYPDPWIRYGILTALHMSPSAKRKQKLDDIKSDAESVARRVTAYGRIGDAVRELFDDDGWMRKDVGWVPQEGAYHQELWRSTVNESGGDRGGKRVGDLERLKGDMSNAKMRLSEVAKILEVFSRPRCKVQEEAALARLGAYKIELKLKEEEQASTVPRYRPTVDPALRRFLADRVADETFSADLGVGRTRAAELLRSESVSRAEMAKVGKIVDDLGFDISAKPKTALTFKPEELLELRLKLLKLYEDSFLVDVMMAQVMRSGTTELANARANAMIDRGNKGQQNDVRASFRGQVDKLERMEEELSKYFTPAVVEVIKADIMNSEQWDAVYADMLKVGVGKQTDRAAYDAMVAACKSRAVHEEYYQKRKKGKGVLTNLLAKVPIVKHHFT